MAPAGAAARLAALVLPISLALLVAGCRLEDAQQEAAREEVERALAGRDAYEPGGVRCTRAAGAWFVEQETHVFLCVARRRDGGCDTYRVEAPRIRPARVLLHERDSDCTLPL